MPLRKPRAMPRNWLKPNSMPPRSSHVRVAELLSAGTIASGTIASESFSGTARLSPLACIFRGSSFLTSTAARTGSTRSPPVGARSLPSGCRRRSGGGQGHGGVQAGEGLPLDLSQGEHVAARLAQDEPDHRLARFGQRRISTLPAGPQQ